MNFNQAMQLIPLVLTAVQTVERMVSGIRGPEKQEMAVDVLTGLVPLAGQPVQPSVMADPEVQTAIRNLIDAQVALANVVQRVHTQRLGATANLRLRTDIQG